MKPRTVRDVELVVFDLDGTLVDSREDIAASVNHGLLAVGGSHRPAEQIYPLIGQPLVRIFAQLLPAGLEAEAAGAAEAYKEHHFDHCFDRSRIYPGVVECLDRLKPTPLVVATTKMTYMAVRVVERAGLAGHFILVQGSEGIPYKPDPALLQIVLGKTARRADRTWMVGDTVYDIRAGKAAGMRTCAVTYGIGSAPDLRLECPDLVLDSLDQLPPAIGS